mmetsp:Transcript_31114/g.56446  ORF Transcript_31114/g.56446 Transcript_31114/m.56446 type:complete len:293 (+) Transcript_31114:61-939(+)
MTSRQSNLKLVKVLGDIWDALLETLALADGSDAVSNLSSTVNSSIHRLPVVKRALRESLSSCIRTKVSSETERFHNWEVCQKSHLRGSGPLLLREDMSTTLGEDTVHVTHSILWNRDVTQIDGFKKIGFGSQQRGEADTTGGRHDLSHTTVNGISMEDDIHEVEPGSTHLFLTKGTILGSPGETTYDRLLNFKKVVNTLGGVDKKVGSSSLGSKGPNLTGFGHIPSMLISHLTALSLGISRRKDLLVINRNTELSTDSVSLNVKTVVLVGRLGKTGLVRLASTSLTEGHNGI